MPNFVYNHDEEKWEDETQNKISRGGLVRFRVVNVVFGSKSEVVKLQTDEKKVVNNK
jgi:DNA-directed RNA polymerase subunit E'/Rpb7